MQKLLLFCFTIMLLFSIGNAEEVPAIIGQNLFIVNQNEGCCICDAYGERTSAFYDSIDPFFDNVSVASRNGKFGLLTIDGNEILPCEYESIDREDDCFVVQQYNEYGLCYGLSDAEGNILVAPFYHELFYENGMAAVIKNGPEGGAGIIDKTGNIVVPLIYENIAPFTNGWAWIVDMYYRSNFVNKQGEYLLDDSADTCEGFFDNYALVGYGEDIFIISSDKNVYRKLTGNPICYLGVNGMFLIDNGDDQSIYYADTDEYISLENKTVDLLGYNDGLLAIRDESGKWGFMDESLHIVIPCVYDSVQPFSNGRTWATVGEEYLFLDTDGICHFSEKLTKASPFSDGLAAIKTGDLWGFIDESGSIKLAPSLESEENNLMYINGYCDLAYSDPYAAIYIDKEFRIFSQYDLWEIINFEEEYQDN